MNKKLQQYLIDDYPHYYLDIETTGLDPKIDQILTIQYQKISVHTGKSAGGYSD